MYEIYIKQVGLKPALYLSYMSLLVTLNTGILDIRTSL